MPISFIVFLYSLCFILSVVLDLCTRIKETINFACFLYKNTITYTPKHISTNRKTNNRIKINKFCIENRKRHIFCNKKFSVKRHLI